MKLWELRSYDEVIRMEQDRLVYETRLRARYGRGWRRKAPVEALMPLKLVRYGVPLTETAPGSTTLTKTAARETASRETAALETATAEAAPSATAPRPELRPLATDFAPGTAQDPEAGGPASPGPAPEPAPEAAPAPEREPATRVPAPRSEPEPESPPLPESAQAPGPASAPVSDFRVPVSPGRSRPLAPPTNANGAMADTETGTTTATLPQDPFVDPAPAVPQPEREPEREPEPEPADEPVGIPDGTPREEVYFAAYRQYVAAHGAFPSARQLSRALHESFGVTTVGGGLLSEGYLRAYMREFRERYNTEMGLAG